VDFSARIELRIAVTPFVTNNHRVSEQRQFANSARQFYRAEQSPLLLARLPACSVVGMPEWFLYILKNAENPPRYYTGHTSDVARRHAEHNAGASVHTAKYRPWSVDVVIAFPDERRAVAFERYLKSGSGVALAQRHFR
jgi:putative endonuclease